MPAEIGDLGQPGAKLRVGRTHVRRKLQDGRCLHLALLRLAGSECVLASSAAQSATGARRRGSSASSLSMAHPAVRGGLGDRRAGTSAPARRARATDAAARRSAISWSFARQVRRRRAGGSPRAASAPRRPCGRDFPRRRSRAGSPVLASRRRRRARRCGAPSRSRRPARADRRSPRRLSRRRSRGSGARARGSTIPSRAATSATNRAPSRLVARSSRWSERGPESEPLAEQRTAQIGPAAARAADDALRRPLERRAARPRCTPASRRRAARGAIDVDVELVARRAVERPPAVGADLGADAEVAEERERAAGRGRAAEIEVDRELAVAAQVPGARARGRAPRARRAGSSRARGAIAASSSLSVAQKRHMPSSASRRRL